MNIKLKGAYSCHIDRYTVPWFVFSCFISLHFLYEKMIDICFAHTQLISSWLIIFVWMNQCHDCCKPYTTFCFKFLFLFFSRENKRAKAIFFFFQVIRMHANIKRKPKCDLISLLLSRNAAFDC